MTGTNRYIYVAWKNGEVGSDGTFSLPKLYTYKAKDGVGEVSAFQMAAEQPTGLPQVAVYETFLTTADTTDLGNGWTKKVVNKNATLVVGGTVTNVYRSNSAWYSETKNDGNTWWRNPSGVGANNSSETKIYFTTSDDNMVVTFYLMASSEANCDFISITEVDSTEIKTKISGDGVTSGALQFEVKTAGTHYVTVTYRKDSSLDRYNDCGYVRLAKDERWVKRYPPIYRCHGVVVNNTIQWGDIIKETGDKGEQGEQGEQGEPGIQGSRGYNGCIFRTSIWKTGVEYHNDTDLEGNGDKYIDIVYVADSSTDTGWRAFKCTETHTSGSTMGSKWEELSGVGPIYTPLILAKNAVFELAQGQSFTLVRNNTTFGCFRTTKQQSDFALWLGAKIGRDAPFGVTAGGKLIATNAVIKGEITATSGSITGNMDVSGSLTVGSGSTALTIQNNSNQGQITTSNGNGIYVTDSKVYLKGETSFDSMRCLGLNSTVYSLINSQQITVTYGTTQSFNVTVSIAGGLAMILKGLPTTKPSATGQVWRDGEVLKIVP